MRDDSVLEYIHIYVFSLSLYIYIELLTLPPPLAPSYPTRHALSLGHEKTRRLQRRRRRKLPKWCSQVWDDGENSSGFWHELPRSQVLFSSHLVAMAIIDQV